MSRGKGHSAVAGAAYRAGVSLVDERTGEVHDYSRKGGVLSAEIVTPDGVPVPDRGELWNKAEAAESRKDSRVAREWRIALPGELDDTERKALAVQMGKTIADRYGVAVDVCVHAPDRDGDERNFHAHMMATTRTIGADGELGAKSLFELGNKDRRAQGISGTSVSDLVEIRATWAGMVNDALERAGLSERIDHRSYADQGVELTPTTHIGPTAQAMARRGVESERVEIHQATRDEQARQIIEKPEIVLEKISATQAVFTRRDIARELNRYIDDADQFQNLMTKLEASPQLVELEQASQGQPAKLSTREMVAVEAAMVDTAERMHHASGKRITAQHVNAAIDANPSLSGEQANAIRHVAGAEKLAVIIGDAGTGKSYSMKIAREVWESKGLRVRGAALAGKAADELQEGSGINSRTLASLEHAWKRGKDKLTSSDVLVIDEAGMIGSRQLGRILEAADKAGAKVVLLGDDKQLAAIDAGAAFRAVVERVGAAEITQIRRQKQEWAREASQQFARGSVAEGMDAYAKRGHVHMHEDRAGARQALARAYVADAGKGSQIVLAHSNKDVKALNEAIRAERKAVGSLGEGVRIQTEKGGREFAQGDRIVFLRNDSNLQVKNGTLGTVEQTENGTLAVRLDNGERRQVNPEQYGAVDHGYAVTVHKAQGVTVDRAYVLATPGMDRSLAYVGMTRHRDEANLFAGGDDFPAKNGRGLVASLERQRAKESTLDFADRRGFDGAGVVRRMIDKGREKLAAVAGRLEVAARNVLAKAGRKDQALMPVVEGKAPEPQAQPDPVRWVRPSKRAAMEQQQEAVQGVQAVEGLGEMAERSKRDHAEMQAARAAVVAKDAQEARGEVHQSNADYAKKETGVPQAQPDPVRWVRPSKRAAMEQQQEAVQGVQAAPMAMQQQKEQVIEATRAADPERRALADTVRAQFEGKPLDQIERVGEQWDASAAKLADELNKLKSHEDFNNMAGPLRAANVDLAHAKREHKDAWAAMEHWQEANKVKAAMGMGGAIRRELEETVNKTADKLEAAQARNDQVQSEHKERKASVTAKLEQANQYRAGLAALVSERMAEDRALGALGPKMSDQQAEQHYRAMVDSRSSEIRGQASRLATRIEVCKEAVENAYRAHRQQMPKEPAGLAAMVPGAKAKYRAELDQWQAREKAIGRRSKDLMMRGRVAQRYRSELDSDRAAGKKVARENPVLVRRFRDIEERKVQENLKRAQEMTKAREQERNRGDRGPYRGR